MEISGIRDLIINNKIDRAFELLLDRAPEDLTNDVALLSSQFNHWEKQSLLNLDPPVEERNRIVYATLHILSQIEKESKSGLAAKRLQSLAEVEEDLAKGYEKLASLRSKGAIDLFMTWLINRHPSTFQNLLEEEKKSGRASSFVHVLSSIGLSGFISEYGLNTSPQQVAAYLAGKNGEIPGFFSGWLEYSGYREKFASDLEKEIEKYKRRHQSLLRAGVVGAVLGTALFQVFERSMDKVILLHETSLVDNGEPDWKSDSDDDDDDD